MVSQYQAILITNLTKFRSMNLASLKYRLSEFQLWKTIKKHATNNTIVLVFANYGYRDVLDVWINSIEKCNVKNYLVVSLDKEIHAYLFKKNIQTYYNKTEEDLSELWASRTLFISKVLHMGFNVIHSDADAIWCQNPQREYFSFHHFDIVFSQGTIFPPEIHEKWGFVLCCGLYGIKSNKSTRILINKVIKDIKESSKDDQRSFNRVIYENNISWYKKNTYELNFRGRSVKCSESIIEGESEDFKVALLPHKLFQRLEEDSETIYLKHWLLSRDKLIKNIGA